MNSNKNKCLVVGANSFLAKEIILRLQKENEVTAVYHINKDNLVDTVKSIPLSNLSELKDEYKVVFIVSAYIPEKNKVLDHRLLNEVNVDLPRIISRKFKNAKIVYASSVSVYGNSPGILSENSPFLNVSDYGISKREGEKILMDHSHYSIIRISSMYGKGMNQSTFLPLIVHSAIENNVIKLFGKGERAQNYIHVSDVADFFIQASQKSTNNMYLAVGENSYTNLEIASFIKNELPEVKIEFNAEDNSQSFFYDASETYKSLSLKPEKNIQEGISELIKWQQKKF